MAAIWRPENRFRIWFEIEAHACDAMAEMGVIPKDAAKAIWTGGAKAMEALDLDFLTEHITTFCLAALGQVPPLNAAGEAAVDEASVRP